MKMFNFKAIRMVFMTITIFATSVMSTSVFAEIFYRSGNIQRVLSDSVNYGGCMIHLSSTIANGCPNSGWVSLDCNGQFSSSDNGKRAYASALVAFSLGKQISVNVNNSNKVNGYCVVERLDIIN